MSGQVWDVTFDKPTAYSDTLPVSEAQLETWIESEPGLVGSDLCIVGRQVRIEGGRIDLLALNRFGNWIVIEIKKNDLYRDTFAQAIDYVSCIEELPESQLRTLVDNYLRNRGSSLNALFDEWNLDEAVFYERNVSITLVGTGKDESILRVSRALSRRHVQIDVVSLRVFAGKNNERLLTSTIDDSGVAKTTSSPDSAGEEADEVERLLRLSEKNGIGREFRNIYERATQFGLFPRPYKWSIMYTPQSNKTRCMIVTWVKPVAGKLDLYVATRAFSEFFPIQSQEAESIVEEGRYRVSSQEFDALLAKLDTLFSQIMQRQN